MVRELWNGNKATGFIKRHDRLGRSTSLSLELENSLETTVHLITWVPDPISFTRQCLSIPNLFSLSISWIVSKSNAHSREIRKGNEETSLAATWVHCSKVVPFVYYISFQERKRIVLQRKLSNFINHMHTHTHTRYALNLQSWKSWKFEAVCQLLYFATLISSFFLREKSWTPFKEVFSR